MKYSWVLFDADGTLFDYDRAESLALEATFAHFGLGYEPQYQPTYREINAQLWRDFEKGLAAQEEIQVRRFELLFDEIGQDFDASTFGAQYLVHLADGSELFDGTERVVRALHGRVGLMIITNGIPSVQRSRFERSTIRDCFSGLIISGEVGAAKPSAEIFDVAFAAMGHPAREQVLIVGDSLTTDIAGGCRYGIATCWYNPAGKPRPEGICIDHEIHSLDQLLSLRELQQVDG